MKASRKRRFLESSGSLGFSFVIFFFFFVWFVYFLMERRQVPAKVNRLGVQRQNILRVVIPAPLKTVVVCCVVSGEDCFTAADRFSRSLYG